MKKLMTSLAFAALIAGGAAAQAPGKAHPTPDERAKRQTERMTKDLSLSAEQVPQVHTINAKYADQLGDLHEQAATEKDAKREAAKGMLEQRNAELKAVLTTEQYDKMLKNQEEMRTRRAEKMKAHKGEKAK